MNWFSPYVGEGTWVEVLHISVSLESTVLISESIWVQ